MADWLYVVAVSAACDPCEADVLGAEEHDELVVEAVFYAIPGNWG